MRRRRRRREEKSSNSVVSMWRVYAASAKLHVPGAADVDVDTPEPLHHSVEKFLTEESASCRVTSQGLSIGRRSWSCSGPQESKFQ